MIKNREVKVLIVCMLSSGAQQLESSSSEDEECEDDGFDIDKQCNVELHFDCTSSSTSGSGSSTQVNVMDDDSVVGGKATE